MCIDVTGISGKAVLAAYLTKLAGPIGQYGGEALINSAGVLRFSGAVVASTHKPAASQLVVGRGVEAECPLLKRKLLTLAPDELSSTDKGMIDRPAERSPAHGSVDPVQTSQKVRPCTVRALRVGRSHVDIGWLGDVLEGPKVAEGADITLAGRGKQGMLLIAGIATEDLSRQFQKESSGSGYDALDGDASVI